MTTRANPYDELSAEDAEQLARIAQWYAEHPNARAWGDVLAGWVRRHAWGLVVALIAALLALWGTWLWAAGWVG